VRLVALSIPQGVSMILCEYRFENFNTRGDDDYLDSFAVRLDELFTQGWALLDAHRDAEGWWQVELYKPTFSDSKAVA